MSDLNRLLRRVRGKLRRIVRGAPPPPYLGQYADLSIETQQVYQQRLDHLIPVDQPLALVSQVQRSGGTLLSQLLDGHPHVHAHPFEIQIGYPNKTIWPDLDLSESPERWYRQLHEIRLLDFFREGYSKAPPVAQYDKRDVFPFLLLPGLHHTLFIEGCAAHPPATQREVLNHYFTAFFNAWLDYQGFYASEEKRYVTGFTPRLNMRPDNLTRFFRDYPKGRMMSVIRDPQSWYASTHRKSPSAYPDVATSIPIWVESAQAMLANRAAYPDRTLIVAFDHLLGDTEAVMRHVAGWLGLDWHPILTTPTFQRMPIKANTAYRTTEYGVIDAPLSRADTLDPADAAAIDTLAADLYAQVMGAADV